MKTTDEVGKGSPANINRAYRSTYKQIGVEGFFRQTQYPNGRKWVLETSATPGSSTRPYDSLVLGVYRPDNVSTLSVGDELENTGGYNYEIILDDFGRFNLTFTNLPVGKRVFIDGIGVDIESARMINYFYEDSIVFRVLIERQFGSDSIIRFSFFQGTEPISFDLSLRANTSANLLYLPEIKIY